MWQGGLLFAVVCGLLISGASGCGAQVLGLAVFSSCGRRALWRWLRGWGAWVCLLLSMWDLPAVTEHTCVPCVGRQIPILVPPGKFSLYSLLSNQFFLFLFSAFCHIWGIHVQMTVFLRYIYSVPLVFFSGIIALFIVDSFKFCFILDLAMNWPFLF